MRFVTDEFHGKPAGGPDCAFAFVVSSDSIVEIGCVADVKRAVGTFEDIDEKGIC